MRCALHVLSAGVLLGAATAYSLTFTEWQAEYFTAAELTDPAISGPNADPEGDGQKNLLEYAFARDPFVGDPLSAGVELNTNGLKLTYPVAVGATDLLYHFRESPDLKFWTTPNITSTETVSNDGTVRIVSEFNPFALPSPARAFAGLRVHASPNGAELLMSPSNLAGELTVPFTVTLRWSDNSKIEDSFLIERRTGEIGPWEQYHFAAADTNRWEDWSVLGSTTYFYRASAARGFDASEPTNETRITTPLDTDQDGIPDDLEAMYSTDPLLFSSGNNGVSDGWWVRHGLAPLANGMSDTDGDGRTDAEEFFDRTDPRTVDSDPNAGAEPPIPPRELVLTESTHPEISWTNFGPSSGIKVQRTEDNVHWITVGVLFGNKITFTDATASQSIVYVYRLVAFN